MVIVILPRSMLLIKKNAKGVKKGARGVKQRMSYQTGPYEFSDGIYHGSPLKFVNDPSKPNFRNEYAARGVLSPYRAPAVGDADTSSQWGSPTSLSPHYHSAHSEAEDLRRGRISRNTAHARTSSRKSRSPSRSLSPQQGNRRVRSFEDKHGGFSEGQYFLGKQHREVEVNAEIDAVLEQSVNQESSTPPKKNYQTFDESDTFEERNAASHPRSSIEAWSPTPVAKNNQNKSDIAGGIDRRQGKAEDDAALISLNDDEDEMSGSTTNSGSEKVEGDIDPAPATDMHTEIPNYRSQDVRSPLVDVSFDAVHSACSGVLALVQNLASKQNLRLTGNLKTDEEQRLKTLPSFIRAWREATVEAKAYLKYKENGLNSQKGLPAGSDVPGGPPGVRLSPTFGPTPSLENPTLPVVGEILNEAHGQSPKRLSPTRVSNSSVGTPGTGRHTASRGDTGFRNRVGPSADLSPRDAPTSSSKKKKSKVRAQQQSVEAERLAMPTTNRQRIKVEPDPLDMAEVDKKRAQSPANGRRSRSRSPSKSKSPARLKVPPSRRHQQNVIEDLVEGSPTREDTRLASRRSRSASPKRTSQKKCEKSPSKISSATAIEIISNSIQKLENGSDSSDAAFEKEETQETSVKDSEPNDDQIKKKMHGMKTKHGDNKIKEQKSLEDDLEKVSKEKRLAKTKKLLIERRKREKKAIDSKIADADAKEAQTQQDVSPETNRQKQMDMLAEVEAQVRKLEEIEEHSTPLQNNTKKGSPRHRVLEKSMKKRIELMSDRKVSPKSRSEEEERILSDIQNEVHIMEQQVNAEKEKAEKSEDDSHQDEIADQDHEQAYDIALEKSLDINENGGSDISTVEVQQNGGAWQHNSSDFIVDTKTLVIFSKEGDPVGHWDDGPTGVVNQQNESADLQQQSFPRSPQPEGWVWFHVWTVDENQASLEDVSNALIASTRQPSAHFHGLVTLPHTPVSLLAAWTHESLPDGLRGSEFEKHLPDAHESNGSTIDEEDNSRLVDLILDLNSLLHHGLVTAIKLCQEPTFLSDAQEAASRGVQASFSGGDPNMATYPHGGNLSSGVGPVWGGADSNPNSVVQAGLSHRTLNSDSHEGLDGTIAALGVREVGATSDDNVALRQSGCPLVEVIAEWNRSEADDYDQQYISGAEGDDGDVDIDRSTGANVDILEHAAVGQRMRLLNTFQNGWAFCVHVDDSIVMSDTGPNRSSTGHSLNQMGYIPLDRLSAVIQEPVMESSAGSALLGSSFVVGVDPSLGGIDQSSGTPLQAQAMSRSDRRVDFEASTASVDVAVPQEALLEHARYLGLEWDESTSLVGALQQALCAVVEESIKAPLPMGWEIAEKSGGSKGSNASSHIGGTFVNTWTGQKSNEHPLDNYYRQKIQSVLSSEGDYTAEETLAVPVVQNSQSQVGVNAAVEPIPQEDNQANEWYFVEHAWSPNTPQRLASTQEAPLLSVRAEDGPVRVLSRNDETGWWWCEIPQQGNDENDNVLEGSPVRRGYLPGQYLRSSVESIDPIVDSSATALSSSAQVPPLTSYPQDIVRIPGASSDVATVDIGLVQRAERALFRAVASGNMRAIMTAITNGADAAHALNANSHTPLIHATLRSAPSKLKDVVAYLLQQGADLRRPDNGQDGMQPLHHAARAGRSGACATLLAAGADVNALDSLGLTALHHAVRCGAVECAQLLLERKADVEAMQYPRRQHMVNGEASQGISPSLDEGNEQQTPIARTPLLEALSTATLNVEIARVLIDAGANVLAKDSSNSGASVVHLLTAHCVSVNRKLQKPMTNNTPRQDSVSARSNMSVKRSPNAPYLESNEDQDRGEYLLLSEAEIQQLRDDAEERLALLSEILMREPATLQIVDDFGNTPLHWAMFYNAPEATRCLIEHGADAEAINNEGNTPQQLAPISAEDVIKPSSSPPPQRQEPEDQAVSVD